MSGIYDFISSEHDDFGVTVIFSLTGLTLLLSILEGESSRSSATSDGAHLVFFTLQATILWTSATLRICMVYRSS
jgi:hypothetical protein